MSIEKDRADIERVMSEEKKIVLAVTLRERIKQHEAGKDLANRRITACNELLKKSPSLRDVLDPVINTWARIRSYHYSAIDSANNLILDLKLDTCPHGYRYEDLHTGASVCEACP